MDGQQIIEALHDSSLENIQRLESVMRDMPQVEIATTHHFAHGVYGREIFIPAGTVLVGKIHRHSTLNIIAQGTIRVTTPDGVRDISAPAIYVSPPGTKKAAVALTDVVFVNVHPAETTDLAAIEAAMIEPETPQIANEGTPCLG